MEEESNSNSNSNSNINININSKNTTNLCIAKSSSAKPTRLLFDRRYGWVFDEWRHPSEEALAGGRGMFCIVPLAKALLNTATHTINLATTTTIRVIENPDLLSPQSLQACLNDQLPRFTSSLKKPEFNFSVFNRNLASYPKTESSSHIQLGNSESNLVE
ncbi:hypothetical protein ACFE04_007791 [Oxalis oulophora]